MGFEVLGFDSEVFLVLGTKVSSGILVGSLRWVGLFAGSVSSLGRSLRWVGLFAGSVSSLGGSLP